MHICDVLQNVANNKLTYQRTTSVCNERNFVAKMLKSHYISNYINSLDYFCQSTAKGLQKLKL